MASGFTEEFFYSSSPDRNDELPPPYGEFIFRPPTRRLVVKTSKSFKDKKTKNKGKAPPSRMYATVRDPRIAPGHQLIHPDFITPQQFIPKIVPPQPTPHQLIAPHPVPPQAVPPHLAPPQLAPPKIKPVKPARSKSFNDTKKAAEQKTKSKEPPSSRTYRCPSYPVPTEDPEDQSVHIFSAPRQVPVQPKQRLGLHEELFRPPSGHPPGPASPPYYRMGPEQNFQFGRPLDKANCSGMYVPSNELQNSLTLQELNQLEDEEIVQHQKPQKKKSTVKQILISLFSSKKSGEQLQSKTEKKKQEEIVKPPKPTARTSVARSPSSEITKEKDDEKSDPANRISFEAEDEKKTSGKSSRPSAKILHQNEKQDQIIQELKKKNSDAAKDDLKVSLESESHLELEEKGVESRKSQGKESDDGSDEISRKSDIPDTYIPSTENEQPDKLRKSQSVPHDLFRKKNKKMENQSGNEDRSNNDSDNSKSRGDFIQ
jgi:hypothetical protein